MNTFFRLLLLVLVGFVSIATSPVVFAQDDEVRDEPTLEALEPDAAFAESLPADEYARATVLEILDQGELDIGDGRTQPYQLLKVRLTSGPEAGQEIELDHGSIFSIRPEQILKPGDQFVIVKSYKIDGSSYYAFIDRYRINQLVWFGIIFLALVVLIIRWRGLASFLGLAVSILVLALYEIPKLAAGASPLPTTLVAASLIVLEKLYIAHGYSRQQSIAVGSTIATLLVAVSLALWFVAVAHLSGSGTEDAFNLQFGQNGSVDLRGILLSGILIGVIGVLDDVTTGQVAVVDQLRHANPDLSPLELFKRASQVGREHIISLVNTLALAYAGVSLPLFLMFAKNPQPLWISLNGELFAEEIVRTLVGSIALVLAVPI
ncbi:MAG: YibE/F family protein, partial [Patescibacteria group bacterium]